MYRLPHLVYQSPFISPASAAGFPLTPQTSPLSPTAGHHYLDYASMAAAAYSAAVGPSASLAATAGHHYDPIYPYTTTGYLVPAGTAVSAATGASVGAAGPAFTAIPFGSGGATGIPASMLSHFAAATQVYHPHQQILHQPDRLLQ